MKLKIKEQYKNQILSSANTGDVIVASISEVDYPFYYKSGLAFIFEEVEEEKTPLETAIKQAVSYKENEFKPKSRGKL